MKKYYVPSIDGIPGVMPGNGSLLPDPIEDDENFIPESITNSHVRSGGSIPVKHRKLMSYKVQGNKMCPEK